MKSAKRTLAGGVEIEVTQLPALTLLREWSEVATRVLPVLSALEDAVDRDAAFMSVVPMFVTMGGAADDLAMRLLVTSEAKITDADGPKLVDLNSRAAINEAFAGNLIGLFQAIFFATEVHYGDFLFGAGASRPGRDESAAAESPSNSTPTSTPSG